VLEHARELAKVQTAAASAQAAVARLAQASATIGHARELAALRGELRSRDAEITELKRARIHAGAADVEEPADCGGGTGGGGGGGGGGGSGSASGLQQLQASHQGLRQVKQEKADVGE
jgi:hypothetical protein